jgi:hypothetical protein
MTGIVYPARHRFTARISAQLQQFRNESETQEYGINLPHCSKEIAAERDEMNALLAA